MQRIIIIRLPLILALSFGHKDVVEQLIAKGADVNAENEDK